MKILIFLFSLIAAEFRFFNESCSNDSLDQEGLCIENCQENLLTCIDECDGEKDCVRHCQYENEDCRNGCPCHIFCPEGCPCDDYNCTTCEYVHAEELKHCATACDLEQTDCSLRCPITDLNCRYDCLAENYRNCLNTCPCMEVEEVPCYEVKYITLPDGSFVRAYVGEWKEWEKQPCSISCGGGNQIQTRSCAPLNTNVEYWVCEKIDGNFDFEESAVVECAEKLCPTWSQWSSYNSCSKACGSGFLSRTRECLNGEIGDDGCRGKHEQESDQLCNTQNCPDWSTWGAWSECDSACGGGEMKRTRECPGVGCEGLNEQFQSCNTRKCNENNEQITQEEELSGIKKVRSSNHFFFFIR